MVNFVVSFPNIQAESEPKPFGFCFAFANVDELDAAILDALRADARRSYRTIASLVDSTVPTVSSRIKRMEDLGQIRAYTILEGDAKAPAPGEGAIVCVQCKKTTKEPVIRKRDGRSYGFCCTTCESVFMKKYQSLKDGI